MKTEDRIRAALDRIPSDTQYPAMTYEQGIEDALLWVLGEVEDDEFEYAD